MINFEGSGIGMSIESFNYDQSFTIANMFQYLLQNYQLDPSEIDLSLDGQTMLNSQDNSRISSYFQPNQILYVYPKQIPYFSIYVDGEISCQQQLQNMTIWDLLQGLNLGQNVVIEVYDGTTQQKLNVIDNFSTQLYDSTGGLQNIIINITTQQLQQKTFGSNYQDQKTSSQYQSQQIKINSQGFGASELLQQLILLKNISILIDPNGQFVIYKFHFPTLIQGYLQKSKGKQSSSFHNFNANKQDWIKKNDVEYCSFDNYGFAIRWNDETISSIKIRQQ
ncbi:unnamed protein product [Paramecium sonneborni]|uniref:Uncharacterized protein n=1 Tax=Paramecium sonneborni TaxID=65129 RepID=A0A8S1PHR4_9CILI|nr:unnamed protein product [Paramecium sonneborni]